jgi:hypothetical protein
MPRERARRFFASLSLWERWALVAWSVLLLTVCIRAAVWPEAHSVYPIFALASQKWLAGQNIYLQTKYDVYRYSPLVAAALTPLGLLPMGLGGVLWRLFGAGVYLAALAWWGRSMIAGPDAPVGDRGAKRTSLAVFLLLVLPLSLDNLNNGQSNVLMIGLVMLGILACGSKRWNLAAACLAVACLFKIYPLAVAMLLAAVYPRRFTGRFIVVLAAGLLLPFLLQRPAYVAEQYTSWIAYLQQDERQSKVLELWYRDVRLLGRVCGIPLSAGIYALIQLAAGASIAAVCLAARRQSWPFPRLATLLLGLGCCWMTAFGVAAETSTYMIMAPIASWLVVAAWRSPRLHFSRWSCSGIYLLFVAARAAGSHPDHRRYSMVAQPAASLLLFLLLMGTALRQLRAGRSATEPQGDTISAKAA